MIIDTKSGNNYRLKELKSGKEMKRFLHAKRLRLLRELKNDYRLAANPADVNFFDGITQNRQNS